MFYKPDYKAHRLNERVSYVWHKDFEWRSVKVMAKRIDGLWYAFPRGNEDKCEPLSEAFATARECHNAMLENFGESVWCGGKDGGV